MSHKQLLQDIDALKKLATDNHIELTNPCPHPLDPSIAKLAADGPITASYLDDEDPLDEPE